MKIEDKLVNGKRIKNSHLYHNLQKFQEKSDKILIYNIDEQNRKDFV